MTSMLRVLPYAFGLRRFLAGLSSIGAKLIFSIFFLLSELFRTPSQTCDDDGLVRSNPSARDAILPANPGELPLVTGNVRMLFDEVGTDVIGLQNM